MIIRTFEKDDAPTVIALWEQCGLTRPWNNPLKDISRKLKVQPELFVVGEIDGQIVASAISQIIDCIASARLQRRVCQSPVLH